MSSRDDLLNNLVADLEPVAPAPDIRAAACLWLLASAAWVVLLTHLVGPIRPNALDQLQAHPRFLAEMVAGLLTVVGLRDQEVINVHPKFFGIKTVKSMFGINKGSNTAGFLCFGNGMDGQGCFT